MSAVKTPIGHRFLALGVDRSGDQYIGLVPSLTSVLNVTKDSVVPCIFSNMPEVSILTLIAAQLVAMAIVDPIVAGQNLVVHNAPDIIVEAITSQASKKKTRLLFTTDNNDMEIVQSSWVYLAPYSGRSDLWHIIPADTACFVGFSAQSSQNELTMLSLLSPYCRKETIKTLYSSHSINTGSSSSALLGQILQGAINCISDEDSTPDLKAVSLETAIGKERPMDPLTVVEWTPASSLPARVTRFDSKPLFKGDKTYWLCGLSGALGISLCDWMIDRGMRYLILTSRNPKIDPIWIANHSRNGVTIKTISWYVSHDS